MSNKKKVLYICPTSGIGGAETFVESLTSHSKYQPYFLLFQLGPLHDRLLRKKQNVVVLEHKPRLSKPLSFYRAHRLIKKHIQHIQPDLVHSTMAYASLFTAIASKQTNTPHVWFQHGPASGWMDQLAAMLPNSCIYCNSNYTKSTQKLLEKKCLPLKKINTRHKTILLGTSLPIITDEQKHESKIKLRKNLNLPEDAIIISMLCRIQKWKGVHIVTQAVAQLKNQLPPKVFFYIWGDSFKNSNYLDEQKKFCSSSNLPIHFPGSTESAQSILAGSDALINASIQPEPFGLSIIEAMSQKTIPIAPNEGGPLEIIENGVNGILFTARDSSSLAEKILQLCKTTEHNDLLKHNAGQAIKSTFNSNRMIFDIENSYNQVIGIQ